MSLVIFKREIDGVLSNVTVDDVGFGHVSKHDRDSFDGYPAVAFRHAGMTSDFETNRENLRIHEYDIKIYTPITEDTDADEDILDKWVDATLDAFDNSSDLNGNAIQLEPTMMQDYRQELTSAGGNLVAEIRLLVHNLVEID